MLPLLGLMAPGDSLWRGRRTNVGWIGRRGVRRGRRGWRRTPPLLCANLIVERAAKLVRGALEFIDAAAQRAAQLRQFARPKNDQGHDQNDEHLRKADRTHMKTPVLRADSFSIARRARPPGPKTAHFGQICVDCHREMALRWL